MLKNYLKIAVRNLSRRRGYAAINIAGLALGLACCLLIGLYVQHELNYDQFHTEADEIYRLIVDTETQTVATTGASFRPFMEEDFPEIESMVRITTETGLLSHTDPVTQTTRRFEEEAYCADANFFEFFDFPLLRGDPATVLQERNSIVLSETLARKYFGDADPIGKLMMVDNDPDQMVTVTGIMEQIPTTSHLQFDVVVPYNLYLARYGAPPDVYSFYWPVSWTYLRVGDEAEAQRIEAALPDFSSRHREASAAEGNRPRLESVTDVHLYSEANYGPEATGAIATVYLFSTIALFILLLACINFMNLSTARSAERAREVGVRKSIGAQRGQLMGQFLSESILLSLAGLTVAVVLAEVMLPFFNQLSGKELTLRYTGNGVFWVSVLGAVLLTGLLAGSYPAFVLSRFRPAIVLKGAVRGRAGGLSLRRALVVTQFTISIALVTCALLVYQQLQYMQNARLGFDDTQIVALPFPGNDYGNSGEAYEVLKQELVALSNVIEVTSGVSRPGLGYGVGYNVEVDGAASDEQGLNQAFVQGVDYGFFDLLGLEPLAGRVLDEAYGTDEGTVRQISIRGGASVTNRHEDRGFVINETLARQAGWSPQEALGKSLRFYISENGIFYQDYWGEVVGVVPDIHQTSLRNTIEPLAYMASRSPANYYLAQNYTLVKVRPGQAMATMDALENVWDQVVLDEPFQATFLDEALDAQYREERRLGQILGSFTVLAILIACLGLLGLAAFTAEQRTKEIGVRKVLGATSGSIVALLSRELVLLVALAGLVAAPIAYLSMERWLTAFAYRIDPNPLIFLGAAAVALLVALATVSSQTFRAATTDPAKALRYE
ncbi:MAG: ABC transporter permease [Bacteroidota bacterium]